MSGKRVLAVYAALLLGFAVVLCRLYLLAQHPAYAARAAAQSTVTLQLPARRGNFYDAQGRLLTGLEERWQVVCFPGQGNYDRLYACTDAAGQALLYRSRSRAAPFLLEVSCDPARLSAVCGGAAVSAFTGLSRWYRPRRCRAGKGAGRCTFRHRGAQQPCLRRDGAGYAGHRRNG